MTEEGKDKAQDGDTSQYLLGRDQYSFNYFISFTSKVDTIYTNRELK